MKKLIVITLKHWLFLAVLYFAWFLDVAGLVLSYSRIPYNAGSVRNCYEFKLVKSEILLQNLQQKKIHIRRFLLSGSEVLETRKCFSRFKKQLCFRNFRNHEFFLDSGRGDYRHFSFRLCVNLLICSYWIVTSLQWKPLYSVLFNSALCMKKERPERRLHFSEVYRLYGKFSKRELLEMWPKH